ESLGGVTQVIVLHFEPLYLCLAACQFIVVHVRLSRRCVRGDTPMTKNCADAKSNDLRANCCSSDACVPLFVSQEVSWVTFLGSRPQRAPTRFKAITEPAVVRFTRCANRTCSGSTNVTPTD